MLLFSVLEIEMSDCECESEESAARLPELVFYVNGKRVVVKNPCPKTFLVQYLREKLFLTGTKIACGEGGCGSCTVMISQFDRSSKSIHHYARNACLTPICALHGLAVTTIEALGSTKTKLHPLQIKLVEGHGIQCGFCTPGMIMSMYALLRNNTSPTDLQVEDAIKGNLCRCTGYRPILDSFRNFVKNDCPMGEKCCQNQSGKETNEMPEKCCDEISPSSQELIFPNELQLSDQYDAQSIVFRSEHITWYNPVTVEEVLTLKKFFSGALVFAGGNSACFRIRHASRENSMIVIGLNRIPELNCIEKNDFGISVGATVTISKLEKSLNTSVQELPESRTRLFVAFLETFKRFGSAQIRNTSVNKTHNLYICLMLFNHTCVQ
jgi:xanthine dehydrogenase/oxidase